MLKGGELPTFKKMETKRFLTKQIKFFHYRDTKTLAITFSDSNVFPLNHNDLYIFESCFCSVKMKFIEMKSDGECIFAFGEELAVSIAIPPILKKFKKI